MTMYVIIVFIFSLIIGVLGFQNYTKDADGWATMQEEGEYSGIEYKAIGRFWGNLITIVRMSVGDNDFDSISEMKKENALMFWLVWVLILYIMCIIFLNFIIAEASASYENVSNDIDNFLQYQRANLINESEDMMPTCLKNQNNFPKYLVVRETEE